MSIKDRLIAECEWAIEHIENGEFRAIPETRSFFTCLKRELQPRVLSWEEIESGDYDFGVQEFRIQGKTGELYPVVLYKTEAWGPYFNKDENFIALCEKDDYKKRSRVWTSRPTEEQSKSTPWED